jgi:AcrR family transcriptional regulator
MKKVSNQSPAVKNDRSDGSSKKPTRRVRVGKQPRQNRSQQTYDALLDAAERLLREQPWEKISTVSIMVEAGVSNGAIYGRFKSKDELLVALYERHNERLRSRFKNQQKQTPVNDETLDQFLSQKIDQLIRNFKENRWLLQAMGMLSRRSPEVVSEEMRGERKDMFKQIAAQFLEFEFETKSENIERDMELTVFFVATILREAILYQGPHFATLDLSESELKESLKQLAIRFLGANPEATPAELKIKE